MLPTGSHSLRRVSSCDEGVYLMYTTEEQDEKRPRYAKQWQLDIIKHARKKLFFFNQMLMFCQ